MDGLEIFNKILELESDIETLKDICEDISDCKSSTHKIAVINRTILILKKEINTMKTTLANLKTDIQ